jgi:glutamyl-tRNA synthetase
MIELTMVGSKKTITRFAPSPTGDLHIGGLRTALYSYALAKQNSGKFILRIEDTDQKRYVKDSEKRIMDDLKDYGLTWDEGPIFQSQRNDIYKKYIQQLIDKDLVYYCFCTKDRLEEVRQSQRKNHQQPKYDKHCLSLSKDQIEENLKSKTPYTIRLNVPQGKIISFNDIIRGQVKFNTDQIDDQILIKTDGVPTYHFAAIVDDHLMEVTHIFRGEEWLSSTPKHILLYQNFNWEVPQFGHLSVFLAEGGEKGKMSKRQGATQARQFLEEGYLPEAILNFLMLLGWNPGTEQEYFSLQDFVKEFNVTKLNKKSVVFDRKKLSYFNGYYIRQKNDQQLFKVLRPFVSKKIDNQVLKKLLPLLKKRILVLKEADELLAFLYQDKDYSSDLFIQKKIDLELAKEILPAIKDLFNQSKDWTFDKLQPALLDLIKKNNWHVGNFFMVLRIAVCASPFTLPIVELLPVLGKEATLKKIDIAFSKLK